MRFHPSVFVSKNQLAKNIASQSAYLVEATVDEAKENYMSIQEHTIRNRVGQNITVVISLYSRLQEK
jgi:hypothetical protein